MDENDTSRLEAFSDGVFAVAITLLALNIKIPGLDLPAGKLFPDDGENSLWHVLSGEWPMLIAYITSFATVGVMWINHHRLYKHIRRTDTVLLLLNLLLLLIIVLEPVPTALLAEYLVRPDLYTAALLYSGTNFVMSICFNLLWRYAAQDKRLLGKDVEERSIAAINRQYAFGPVLYIVACVLARFNTPVCIIFNFMLALFFAMPSRPLRILPQNLELKVDEYEVEQDQD